MRKYFERIQPLPDEAWQVLLDHMRQKNYSKNDIISSAGSTPEKIGILQEGVIRAYISDESGAEYTKTIFTPLHFTTPVSFVGAYSSLVTGTPSMLTLEALTDAMTYEMNYSQINDNFDQYPALERWARKLAEFLFVSKEIREFQYFTMDASQRYAIFLAQFPELEGLVPQYIIAQYLGITPTQLSRIRKKMKVHQHM